MHELSICLAVIEQVERIVARHRAKSVSAIVLDVGPLSGVEPQLLDAAWPLAAVGTVAADARLDIESAELIVTCTECGHETAVLPNRLLCGSCGGYRTRVTSGDEMILKRLELDFEPAPLTATH